MSNSSERQDLLPKRHPHRRLASQQLNSSDYAGTPLMNYHCGDGSNSDTNDIFAASGSATSSSSSSSSSSSLLLSYGSTTVDNNNNNASNGNNMIRVERSISSSSITRMDEMDEDQGEQQPQQQSKFVKRHVFGLIRRLSSSLNFPLTAESSSSTFRMASSSSSSLDSSEFDLASFSQDSDDSDITDAPAPPPPSDAATAVRSTSIFQNVDMKQLIKYIKYTYSMCLLTFCVTIIMCGIWAVQTPIAISIHWIVALVLMWVLILWLGQLEGGQGCLVGLEPIDPTSYVHTHKLTHQCTSMTYQGNNLKRFIVGRQFLVVIVVFALNLCCTVVKDAVVPGFPHPVVDVFLESGMAILIVTVIIGQLAAEVCATSSMLDFINSPISVGTTWLCLAIEASGLLHSVYLVQHALESFSGTSDRTTSDDEDKCHPSSTETSQKEKKEEESTLRQKIFFWGRVVLSMSLLSYACVVTLVALVSGQTTMYEGPTKTMSVLILVFLVCFLGVMEAMQIALFAVVNLPKKAFEPYPQAKANCDLAFTGSNFQAFLIGRQICVTMSMFLLARVTTTEFAPLDVDNDDGAAGLWGMNQHLTDFFNTGLPGAFITTIVASLAWRILAACFPMGFLNCFVVYPTIRLCLFLESTGIFSTAWLCAKGLCAALRLQSDEHYLGADFNSKDPHKNKVDEETLSLTSNESSV